MASDNDRFEKILTEMAFQIRPDTNQVVMLSEIFFRLFEEAACAQDMLPRLKDWAHSLGFAFEVVAYLRDQYEVMHSLYNQWVKWDGLHLSFAEWAPLIQSRYDYERALLPWADLADAIHVHLYEDAKAKGGIVDHFGHFLDLRDDAVSALHNLDVFRKSHNDPRQYIEQNMGLSDGALEALLTMTKIAPELAPEISELLFAVSGPDAFKPPYTDFKIRDAEYYTMILNLYGPSNERIVQRWRGGTGPLFPVRPARETDHLLSAPLTQKLLAQCALITLRQNLLLKAQTIGITPGVIRPGGEHGREWFIRGWGRPEGWGAWTIGKEAEIALMVPEGTDFVHLRFDCGAFIAPGSPQSLNILANGTSVASWTFAEGSENQYIVLEFEHDPTIRLINLCLQIPNARSPLSLGISSDHRELGLALRSVEILTRQAA